MKPLTILLVSIFASAATAGLLYFALADSGTRRPAANAAGPDPVVDLARAVEGLRAQQAEIEKALQELRLQVAAKESTTRVPVGEIDAAVARALKERAGTGDALAGAESKGSAKAAPKGNVRSFFDKLAAEGLSFEDRQALWREADKAGVLEELVALYEQYAKDFPNDPTAQVALGNAYLQQVFKVGGGPEAGRFATKADQAFDRALTLDDHNWQARFSKAVSLSNWPAFLGKQQSAIENFEVLVKQQAGQPVRPEFAQTHLILGNMYVSTGEKAKALAAYQQGLAVFPNDAALREKIAGLQGQ
ncbi:MAG: hypothetical protein JNL28_15425 [Planctomycetes bacterium]|nr:hypothetical protein [Planctomycetota bacterium]